MAVNSQSRGIASLGKRLVSQIRSSTAPDLNLLSSLSIRRAVHGSVYEKNIDEQVRPALVPEEAITQKEPEKYWAPHPKTGVFGPADEQNADRTPLNSPSGGSVLEEKAFFRPLEDLEKPQHP